MILISSLGLLGLGVAGVLLLALPYVLHADSQRVVQPVVRFRLAIWKLASLTLFMLVLDTPAALLLLGLGRVLDQAGSSMGAAFLLLYIPLILVTGRIAFIQTWLHLSYWHYERQTTLQIDRATQLATYIKGTEKIQFALTDLLSITQYECRWPGGWWRHWGRNRVMGQEYQYQIWELRDGTELILTCLLYDFTKPAELVPQVRYRQVQPRVCWLPGSPLITWRYANTFYL